MPIFSPSTSAQPQPWQPYGVGIALLLTLDQASKIWATQQGGAQLNSGISFGLIGDVPPLVLTLILTAVWAGVVAVVARSWQTWSAVQKWAGVLLVVGGGGNLIDRWLWGSVIDWLALPGLGIRNNLADWYITAGVALWLGSELFRSRQAHRQRSTHA